MVAIGLSWTMVEAAKRAVLGAGAKVVGVPTVDRKRDREPKGISDLILLAGDDGGDRERHRQCNLLGKADLKLIVFMEYDSR
jgi:hypothetical protein